MSSPRLYQPKIPTQFKPCLNKSIREEKNHEVLIPNPLFIPFSFYILRTNNQIVHCWNR